METRNQTQRSGVTAENYVTLAGAAFERRGTGFVLALEKGKRKDVEFEPSIREWGAWRAYFKAIGHKQMAMFMDGHGRTKDACITVPAQWPHEFDGNATVQGDMDAGMRFARNFRPERIDMADAAKRAITVANYRRFTASLDTGKDAA